MSRLAGAGDEISEDRAGGLQEAGIASPSAEGEQPPTQPIRPSVGVPIGETGRRQRFEAARDLRLLPAHELGDADHAEPVVFQRFLATEDDQDVQATSEPAELSRAACPRCF